MNPQERNLLWTCLIGVVSGLIGNVVAGYLTPPFEERRWLAVFLFALVTLLGLWRNLVERNSTTPQKLLTYLQSSLTRVRHVSFADLRVWLAQRRSPWSSQRLRLPLFVTLFFFSALLIWACTPTVNKLWAQNAPTCPPTYVCILVAELLPTDSEIAQGATTDIWQQMKEVLNKLAPSRYVLRSSPAISDTATAESVARQDGSLLVVWGEVQATTKQLRIHFELVDRLGVNESRQVRAYRAQPLLYDSIGRTIECFHCFYTDLAGEVAQQARMVAYTAIGLVDYVQGRYKEAEKAFTGALTCLGAEGELLDAVMVKDLAVLCPSIVAENISSALLYYYLGKARVLQGNYQAAIAALTHAAALNPYDPAALIGIGSAYQSWLGQKDAQPALDALLQATARAEQVKESLDRSRWPLIDYNVGLINELLGDETAAAHHYAAVVDFYRDEPVAAYIALVALSRVQRKSDPAAARQTLEQARTLDSSAPWAYLELAFLDRHDRRLVAQHLNQAARYAAHEAYVSIVRAELCEQWWRETQQLADHECAATAYTEALTRQTSGWLYGQIGELYLPTNPLLPGQSWERAANHFRASVALRPNDPWAHERLAYVLLNQQVDDEAIEHYEQTIALSYLGVAPAGIYCNLGVAQARNGMAAAAKQNYERCAQFATTDYERSQAEELLKALAP